MIYLLIASISAFMLVWIFRTYGKAISAKKSVQWMTKTNSAQSDAAEEKPPSPRPGELDFSEINRAYRIADMHFSRGDILEAEKWFIKVLAAHEHHAEALNKLGVIYIQQGNPRRAEILYRKLLSITQKEPTYYCNYGRCLYNQKRFADAIEAYENAIKLDCTKSSRFISIGQIYYEQKDFPKALSYFVKAVELDPKNLDYLSITADIAQLTGDMDRVHKSLDKMLELDPYNAQIKERIDKLAKTEPIKAIDTVETN